MSRQTFLSSGASDDGWGSKTQHAPDAEIDVTPLVDCVFLLLSFFMLTSSMQTHTDQNLPAAANGSGVDPHGTTTINIVAAEPEPRILLDGRESRVEDVPAFVEAGVERQRPLVVIRADRTVRHGFVQKVARAVDAVEGATFSIGVLDKKHR